MIKEKLFDLIAAHPSSVLITFVVLFVLIVIISIQSHVRKKKGLSKFLYQPGQIVKIKENDYLVVSPTAKLTSLETNSSFYVYECLDRIWKNPGEKLKSFYERPFGILMRISNLEKNGQTFFIIVSDRNGAEYRLESSCLPETYSVSLKSIPEKNSEQFE